MLIAADSVKDLTLAIPRRRESLCRFQEHYDFPYNGLDLYC